MIDISKLDKEFEDYSPEELEYIYETQQDEYSEEELAFMLVVVNRKMEALRREALQYLPDEIECEKCGAPNAYINTLCEYCKYPLDKTFYEKHALAIAAGEEDEFPSAEVFEESHTGSFFIQYVASFLIPLVGFILGAVMLGSEDEERSQAGKACIVLALLGAVVSGLAFMFSSMALH